MRLYPDSFEFTTHSSSILVVIYIGRAHADFERLPGITSTPPALDHSFLDAAAIAPARGEAGHRTDAIDGNPYGSSVRVN